MIEKYLLNTNESTTTSILQKKKLNEALVEIQKIQKKNQYSPIL